MPIITQFEDLEIWQKARMLYQKVIVITRKEAVKKDFRFCSQIKSAAGSVMDNIAEGFERDSRLEFINFLPYAKGSSGEVRSQLYRALDEDYIDQDQFEDLMKQYKSLSTDIANFIRYLNGVEIKGQKFVGRK
jgi:four helix bundle protein